MNGMDKSRKFLLFIMIANIFIVTIGATFAYFGAVTNSDENIINFEAAVFEMGLEEDISLIKREVIPSKEIYVDYSVLQRVDENKDFIKPYEENGKLITDETVCIDDNLNQICSIYTFTILNPMTEMDLPVYVSIKPSVNTFENLYFKVLDEDKNIVMEKTPIKQEGQTDETIPVGLSNIKTLPKATKVAGTNEVIPSRATYSIVLWIQETGKNQTDQDSGKIFAAAINIMSSYEDGGGITGVFAIGGTE